MNNLKLLTDRLNVGEVSDLVADESCGAISLFVGTTRDNFEDKKVLSLEYVAYEPMAIKTMEKICDNIRERWQDVHKIAIYHRLGMVPVKDASVIIAISSPHRQASLDAVQYAIEELKKTVPIWKKESYLSDDSTWKENKECPGAPRRIKRCRVDFNACPIAMDGISKNLVQIGADEMEINRRINCFVEKKREEIDLNNILDFTATKRTIDELKTDVTDENSCARTNSIVIKQKDSKGHLRVHRVKNRIGPQIKPDYLQTLDKLMKNESGTDMRIKEEIVEQDKESIQKDFPIGIGERLKNVETHLNMKVLNPRHIYERIKAIENRILYLESISPEYKHFLMDKPFYEQEILKPVERKEYSVDEVDMMIAELQADIEQEELNEIVG